MRILHVLLSTLSLPPRDYGGTERVVWSLAKGQEQMGHEVRYLWGDAEDLPPKAERYRADKGWAEQIGDWPDIVHFHQPFEGELAVPFVSTEHGNAEGPRTYGINTIFLSKKHADNHQADCWVWNGLDWSEYGEPYLGTPQNYGHFLGKAKWPVKNLAGAVQISRLSGVPLKVLGGTRISLSSRGFYAYLDQKIQFCGMVGGETKNDLIRQSKALVLPVRWHEPFGLAFIESLYLGCPVLGTPNGALPEIVSRTEIGLLSHRLEELADGLAGSTRFDREQCHLHAAQNFDHLTMARGYEACYRKVLAGETLNSKPPRSEQSWHTLLD